jgi:hypothetical protein
MLRLGLRKWNCRIAKIAGSGFSSGFFNLFLIFNVAQLAAGMSGRTDRKGRAEAAKVRRPYLVHRL